MGKLQPKQGNKFQDDFAARWRALGKTAWLYRFADAAQNFGRNQRLVLTDEQPADFLCAYQGYLGLIECKSTQDKVSFKRSLIRRPQLKAAIESRLSTTPYHFAVRNENTGQVFLVRAEWIVTQAAFIPWSELQQAEWKIGDDQWLRAFLRT